MKKILPFALSALLFAAPSFAYENHAAGFAVKDGKPALSITGQHFYGFSKLQSHRIGELKDLTAADFHQINFYSNADVQKLLDLKRPFTNKDFEECYQNISLLKRAELDPEIVPSPLLKLFFRTEDRLQGDIAFAPLIEKLGLNSFAQQKLQPMISVGERNKQKYIRISYLFQQGESLFSLISDMTAANDNIYILSSIYVNDLYFAEPSGETVKEDFDRELHSALQKTLKVIKVDAGKLKPETAKAIEQEHSSFVKGFKTMPNARIRASVAYYDVTLGRMVLVPQNWLLLSLKGEDKDMAGELYLTTSLESLGSKEKDQAYQEKKEALLTIIQRRSKNQQEGERDKALEEAQAELLRISLDNCLGNLDAVLVTGSLTFKKDSPFKNITQQPQETKEITQSFLEIGLDMVTRWTHKPGFQKYLNLNNIRYGVRNIEQGVLVNVNADLKIIDKYDYSYRAGALCTAQTIALQQLLQKQGTQLEPQLKNSLGLP